ncbi:hypothetical protein GQL56_09975 [Pseudomonas putida]|nr:hypothetical protein [Pseudomonas putida]
MNILVLMLCTAVFLLVVWKLLKKTIFRKAKQAKSLGIKAIQVASDKHELIAEKTATVADTTRVLSFLATIGFWLSVPTGLGAVGVYLGVVSPPFLVRALPVILAVVAGAAALNSAAQLYSRSKKKRNAKRSSAPETS